MPGLHFEEFEIGHVFHHTLTRTVTEMDNMLFSNMTLNPQPLHIDRHFCETQTEWGQPLVNSLFTLGLLIGISVNDTTVGTTIANLGMSDVNERKLAKGLDSGADVLLIDLEDSVALDAKENARAVAARFLAEARERSERPRLYVRVNALDTGETDADFAAVMPAAPEGIMLPKSVSGASVQQLDAKLAVHEAQNDLPDGSTRIVIVATETAASLFNLGSYAGASARLDGLSWGAEDLSADIGALGNRDASGGFTEPFRMARNLCLFGAVAASAIPIDTVFTNFRDLDGLRREAEEALRDGFTAKMAIHPAQVPVINEVFTPSADAIADARRIVDAFAAAGDPGVVGLDGEMLDRPHLRRAEKLLARARAAGLSTA
eukprot:jgi/Tetstr1/428672/TSEL_018660.t1